MVSWWDVFQAVADGTSIVPSCLWQIRDRCTVTSPKVVLKVRGRVPRRWMPSPSLPCRCWRTSSWSAFSIRTWNSRRWISRPA